MNNANYREHRDISLAMKEKPTTILSVDQLNIEFNGFIGSVQNPEIARELKKSWNQTINNYRSLSE